MEVLAEALAEPTWAGPRQLCCGVALEASIPSPFAAHFPWASTVRYDRSVVVDSTGTMRPTVGCEVFAGAEGSMCGACNTLSEEPWVSAYGLNNPIPQQRRMPSDAVCFDLCVRCSCGLFRFSTSLSAPTTPMHGPFQNCPMCS